MRCYKKRMIERYERQISMDQIGSAGQEKLANSAIFVIGAGGLGSPALTYLAAAGVGCLGLMDGDRVAPGNLNRQFLHGESDINRAKARSAAEALGRRNSEIDIRAYETYLTEENAKTHLTGYDIILGAVDSFSVRSLINRTCLSLGVPYIDGGVSGFSGCVLYANPPESPCLNCIFPEKSEEKEAVGVLGATAGVIGTAMANIALLVLLGLENPIRNKLFLYDGLRMRTDLIAIRRDEKCGVCGGL